MKRAMAPGEFTRAEKEMVAAVVSGANACTY
jgi:AhpD family alkylhydroperoxidase